ncbi:MAG: antitoxin [Verrucomicrobia bacterium]|nr:antitoxin [Verrucomicrobiota bacterium]MCH8528137.1 antitoxin [Kiritimatiellia bacterium]
MDSEEQMISDAFDRGEVQLADPDPELLALLREAGENTFRKDKRINIRLSHHDLEGIQRKASRKGIPYQALISGLIHQYVEGDLKET